MMFKTVSLTSHSPHRQANDRETKCIETCLTTSSAKNNTLFGLQPGAPYQWHHMFGIYLIGNRLLFNDKDFETNIKHILDSKKANPAAYGMYVGALAELISDLLAVAERPKSDGGIIRVFDNPIVPRQLVVLFNRNIEDIKIVQRIQKKGGKPDFVDHAGQTVPIDTRGTLLGAGTYGTVRDVEEDRHQEDLPPKQVVKKYYPSPGVALYGSLAEADMTRKAHQTYHGLTFKDGRYHDAQLPCSAEVAQTTYLYQNSTEVEKPGRLKPKPVLRQRGPWNAYTAYEKVEGSDIHRAARVDKTFASKPITFQMAVAVNLMEALAVFHDQQNILHRDLKSANIMVNLETAEIRIIDLGLSVELPSGQWMEVLPGTGTAPFMARELWSSVIPGSPTYEMTKPTAGRPTDVFAMICVIFEMTTGFPSPMEYDPMTGIQCNIHTISHHALSFRLDETRPDPTDPTKMLTRREYMARMMFREVFTHGSREVQSACLSVVGGMHQEPQYRMTAKQNADCLRTIFRVATEQSAVAQPVLEASAPAAAAPPPPQDRSIWRRDESVVRDSLAQQQRELTESVRRDPTRSVFSQAKARTHDMNHDHMKKLFSFSPAEREDSTGSPKAPPKPAPDVEQSEPASDADAAVPRRARRWYTLLLPCGRARHQETTPLPAPKWTPALVAPPPPRLRNAWVAGFGAGQRGYAADPTASIRSMDLALDFFNPADDSADA